MSSRVFSIPPPDIRMAFGVHDGSLEGRMKRKMLALRKLFETDAQQVIISDGRVEHPVKDALDGKGTIIQ